MSNILTFPASSRKTHPQDACLSCKRSPTHASSHASTSSLEMRQRTRYFYRWVIGNLHRQIHTICSSFVAGFTNLHLLDTSLCDVSVFTGFSFLSLDVILAKLLELTHPQFLSKHSWNTSFNSSKTEVNHETACKTPSLSPQNNLLDNIKQRSIPL